MRLWVAFTVCTMTDFSILSRAIIAPRMGDEKFGNRNGWLKNRPTVQAGKLHGKKHVQKKKMPPHPDPLPRGGEGVRSLYANN
jgi:hypothetical protein